MDIDSFLLGLACSSIIILLMFNLSSSYIINNSKYHKIFQYCDNNMNIDICIKTIDYNEDIEKLKIDKVSIDE